MLLRVVVVAAAAAAAAPVAACTINNAQCWFWTVFVVFPSTNWRTCNIACCVWLYVQGISRFSLSVCSLSTLPTLGDQCVGYTPQKYVQARLVLPIFMVHHQLGCATSFASDASATFCQIFPMHVKSKAVSITTCGNWVTNMVFGYYTPVRARCSHRMILSSV